MNLQKTKLQNDTLPVDKFIAHIIGPCTVNNELLADYLTRHTGASCRLSDNHNPVSIFEVVKCRDQNHIILFDFPANNFLSFCSVLQALKSHEQFEGHMVIYNLDRGMGIEKKCLKSGVHGFFYRDDTLKRILLGIRTICNGGIWIDSDVLTKCIQDDARWEAFSVPKRYPLTSRQIEILTTMATGASNKEIAKILSISPHTIKSHLYSIYQAINVSNRLQASAWVANHLPHLLMQKY